MIGIRKLQRYMSLTREFFTNMPQIFMHSASLSRTCVDPWFNLTADSFTSEIKVCYASTSWNNLGPWLYNSTSTGPFPRCQASLLGALKSSKRCLLQAFFLHCSCSYSNIQKQSKGFKQMPNCSLIGKKYYQDDSPQILFPWSIFFSSSLALAACIANIIIIFF